MLKRFLELRASRFPDHRLVVLGDMVDRGEDSAGVLRILKAESGAVCLMGNHEEMLLGALDNPEANGAAWLRHGGLETLYSFGLTEAYRGAEGLIRMAANLREQLGESLEAWLRALPLWWQSGNLVAAHAGMDPNTPPEQQSNQSLLWGHPDFGNIARRDRLHVAHGHFIKPEASHRSGRISLDTGAYASGKLSFALIDPRLPEQERVSIAYIR